METEVWVPLLAHREKNPQRDYNGLLYWGTDFTTNVELSGKKSPSIIKKKKIDLPLCNTELLGWYFHLLYKEIMNFRQRLYFCSHPLLWRASRTFYLTKADLWIINICMALAINWKLPGDSNWSLFISVPLTPLCICMMRAPGSTEFIFCRFFYLENIYNSYLILRLTVGLTVSQLCWFHHTGSWQLVFLLTGQVWGFPSC